MSSIGIPRVPGRTDVDGVRLETDWWEVGRRVGEWSSGWTARGRNRKIQEAIEEVPSELTDLNDTAEDVFLAVGSQLQKLHSAAQRVHNAFRAIGSYSGIVRRPRRVGEGRHKEARRTWSFLTFNDIRGPAWCRPRRELKERDKKSNG